MKTKIADTPVFNPALPVVHSISRSRLEAIGFIKVGTHTPEGKQSIITTYKRGELDVTYDGVSWCCQNKQIQFIEDLP